MYDPGLTRNDPGSTFDLAPPNDVAGSNPPLPFPRLYHHLALLLPDARVMVGGGAGPGMASPYPKGQYSFEIYYPPYLYDQTNQLVNQPIINSVSANTIDFGTSFNVNVTTQNGSVDGVVLLRPAALTHHFDTDQRYIELVSQGGQGGAGTYDLTVTAPADDLGPEGYYMLFVLEFHTAANKSVPSVAKFVRCVAP